ncbi:MAG: DUF547 domain-containing protein [Xanthomonadales bacterium]
MKFISPFLIVLLVSVPWTPAGADQGADPFEKFRGFDPASSYKIFYDDLNLLYKNLVVDVGRSSRKVAEAPVAQTGTRMKAPIKSRTSREGNRFYFEFFKEDENNRELLETLLRNYESIPGEVPLENFSRDEQLAYWINLYNLTVINEVTKIYPKRSLKRVLTGRKSILSKKLLNVAGVPLSLNDIQHGILDPNYDNNPLIMYGLYQGIIGGPSIRKSAYTGANVWKNLARNAAEFINSNRGTFPGRRDDFEVSSLYERNENYFPDFDADLKEHLLAYLEPPEKDDLQAATRIRPNIDDWTVTDLYGSHPRIGGSFASNSAALLDATTTRTTSDGSASIAGPSLANSSRIIAKSPTARYVSPELLLQLQEMKLKQDLVNQEKATVTVEELGEAPPEPEPEPEPESGGND